ncbi:MAG: hypothetical protein ABIZ91_10650, partial [Gemmatimonadaceae bacterium]
RLELQGHLSAGGSMGAAVLVNPAHPSQGIRAVVRRGAGSDGVLVMETTAGLAISSHPLTAIGDSSALTIEVFADAVRCRCGDAMLSAARNDRGAGRCALVANAASITVLRVRGIDMYRLPFRTSRYEGFHAHIDSCIGVERYDAGSAAEPLASVWSRLGGGVATVMRAEASHTDRESVFGAAASALAIPLLEDPARLHVTLASAASDRWFVLESPEPIDFVQETVLRMERRVVRPGLSPIDMERLGALVERAIRNATTGPRPFPPPRLPVGVRARVLPGNGRWTAGGPGASKAAFTARLVTRYLEVTEVATGVQRHLRISGLSAADREMLRDVTVDLNRDLEIVRWHVGDIVEWVQQPLSIIQNADATKALVLPHGAPLMDGTYRMAFAITRRWFDTIEPAGPANTYLDEAEIVFDIVG